VTGVLLDPPYASERDMGLYAHDSADVAHEVRAWAVENGDNPLARIALCGYEGEHEMPSSWEAVAWKAVGGYGCQGEGRGRENARKERIWFSPHCLRLPSLFDEERAS
jgi:DNA adenine methylase